MPPVFSTLQSGCKAAPFFAVKMSLVYVYVFRSFVRWQAQK